MQQLRQHKGFIILVGIFLMLSTMISVSAPVISLKGGASPATQHLALSASVKHSGDIFPNLNTQHSMGREHTPLSISGKASSPCPSSQESKHPGLCGNICAFTATMIMAALPVVPAFVSYEQELLHLPFDERLSGLSSKVDIKPPKHTA